MRWRIAHAVAGLAMLACCCAAGHAQSQPIERISLYDADTSGYQSIRVPSLAVMDDGVVLCLVTAKQVHSDWGESDVLLRVSEDHGKTWSQPRVLDLLHGKALNAMPIVDRRSNTLHLLLMLDYGKLYHTLSRDHGRTFTPLQDITPALDTYRTRDGYHWTVIAPGPGAGSQLRSGRLMVPMWMSDSPARKHSPTCVTTLYSDDGGKSWQCGEIVAENSPQTPNPNESYLAELSDGRVMINMRNASPSRRRLVSISPDGVSDWSPPVYDDALYEPICQASLTTMPLPDQPSRRVLFFVNPDSSSHAAPAGAAQAPRMNLTIRASLDDGRTWPIAQVLDEGRSAYSDAALGADGRIYVAYESGSLPLDKGRTANRGITFLSIDPQWLLGDATARE